METIFQPEDDGIRNLIEVVFSGLFGILAFCTLLTIISQLIGLSFHTYAIIGCIGIISIILGISYFLYKINLGKFNRGALLLLILTGAICSTIGSVNLRRSSDDFFYIPNVVYMIDNPGEPMSFEVNFFEGGDQCKVISHSWGTSVSFDYLRGGVAYFLQIDFLYVYFILTSILVSFLIPLALYYASSIVIDQPFDKAVGVFFSLGVIFLLAETHRTFGNFSVTRAHQGKTLLLAVGIPFMIGITVRYLNSPSYYRWMTIVITTTALVGATTSAIVILPALGLVICIAHISSQEWKEGAFQNLFKYGTGFFILVGYALFLYINTTLDLGVNSPINQDFPATFEGQWSLIFNQNNPRTLQILLISTALSLIFLRRNSRRFLITWIVAVILIFLNPLTAPLLITYITSSNIYWRLFYIYPFPFVLVITFSTLGKFLRTQRTWIKWVSYLLLTGVLLLSFKSRYFRSIFRFNPQFQFPPGYKLPPSEVILANKIISQISEGPMLAPLPISGIIPIFSSQHPQMIIRSDEVIPWLSACNLPDQIAENRLGAASFIGGDPEGFQDFQEFLEIESVYTRSIVIADDMNSDTVNRLLITYGYTNQNTIDSYQIYSR